MKALAVCFYLLILRVDSNYRLQLETHFIQTVMAVQQTITSFYCDSNLFNLISILPSFIFGQQ